MGVLQCCGYVWWGNYRGILLQLYSLQFVAFLCVALAAYYGIRRVKPGVQWVVLLIASLAFYACTGWHNFFFILLTAISTWGVGLLFGRLEDQSKAARKGAKDRAEKKAIKARFNHKKWIALLAALFLNFGVLSYIKYWNVLLEGLGMGDSFLASSLLLPLGLSFYTFQSVGYLIDAYNGKYPPERNFARFLLFVSWFPQLIQGPINRFDALAGQLYESRSFDAQASKRALLLIGYGMLKKYAIADMLSGTVAACLDHVDTGTPGSIIVFGILLYSAQQYADFSGGIDMVRGVSQLFGVRMADNFRQPYFSVSLGDFWRRWHITLGAWMRDYVFYPFALTGVMQRLGKWSGAHLGKHLGRTLPASIANILVFFLVGLWHGAEAHYIWWGIYNGFVIAAADLCAPLFKKALSALRIDTSTRLWHVWRVVRTFVVVNIGWYFDRIYDFGDCMQAFANTFFNFAPGSFWTVFSPQLADGSIHFAFAAAGCLIVFCVSLMRESGMDVAGALLGRNVFVRFTLCAIVGLLVVASFAYAPASGGFIYANF